jgi:ApaG protein
VSTAVTEGIRVTVRSEFRPDRAEPGRFLFTYTVQVRNEGEAAAQLVSRHWIITDAQGEVQEVVGEGVVGKQPHLEPGEEFEYSSYCVLPTPHGSMHGSYRMVRADGSSFDATIAPFALVLPGAVN